MDWPDMLHAVSEIKYRDWEIHLEMREGPPWLQVRFWAGAELQKGRKWILSPHMTKSELVQTCFKAILTAEEHEAREHFLYRGKRIFGPHIDVDRLHDFCDMLDARTEAAPA